MGETESTHEPFHYLSPEQLANALGFIETPQLLNLRTATVLEYSIDHARAIELKTIYQEVAEEMIDNLGLVSTERADAQIGLILMSASMKFYAGLVDDYNFELLQAQMYAAGIGDVVLVEQIKSMRIQ